MREALDNREGSVSIGGRLITIFRFASFRKISNVSSLATSEHSNYRRAWTTGTDRQRYHLDSEVAS